MRRSFMAIALAASLVSTAPAGFFDSFWTLLSSLWDTKAGCEMDPSGRCLPAPQPSSEIGCEWDPNGRCKPGS